MRRPPRGCCPYMEVATWPGVRAAGGGAGALGGRGEADGRGGWGAGLHCPALGACISNFFTYFGAVPTVLC